MKLFMLHPSICKLNYYVSPEEQLSPEASALKIKPLQWGRIVCILLYFEKYPAELNKPIKDIIISLKPSAPSKIITQRIEQVLATIK